MEIVHTRSFNSYSDQGQDDDVQVIDVITKVQGSQRYVHPTLWSFVVM